MTRYEELVELQMKEYPKSIILTPQEVITWCFDAEALYDADSAHKIRLRMGAVVMTIQWPEGVWYRFEDLKAPVMGYRYGAEPHEYVSGFSTL